MRVAFLGNHKVGVTALATIAKSEEVVGVVAHPFDPEDGVRYESVYEFAKVKRWPIIRGKGNDQFVADFLRDSLPDLILVADYRYLLPPDFLTLAKFGVVNLHPSLLPAYRGRAPINWAILEGETRLGLTAHFIDAGMDSGDIIAQIPYELSQNEDVGDALEKLYPLYELLTRNVLRAIKSGHVSRIAQDERLAFSRPARRPDDGLIDWDQPASQVCNLVRAVAAPYPGAFTFLKHEKVMVWRAQPVASQSHHSCGSVIGFDIEGDPVVMCADSAIVLKKFDIQQKVMVGDRFGRDV